MLRSCSKSWPASTVARSWLPAERIAPFSKAILSRGSGDSFRTSSTPNLRHFILASEHLAALLWKSKPKHSHFKNGLSKARRERPNQAIRRSDTNLESRADWPRLTAIVLHLEP